MENCLANTGANSIEIIIFATAAVGIAVIFAVLSRRTRTRASRGMFVFALVGSLVLSSLSPTLTHADACPPAIPATVISSKPITSSGNAIDPQSISVLQYVTPSQGATLDLSTLELGLPAQPVAGSTVSADRKTVTTPEEGTYTAAATGTITYTPATDLTGTIEGVSYTVKDTAGYTTKNTYKPEIKKMNLILPIRTSVAVDSFDFYWDSTSLMHYSLSEPGIATVRGLVAGITDKGTGQTISRNLSNYIDIDLITPGIQHTLDRTTDLGWTAVYDPATDALAVTVTNVQLFLLSVVLNSSGDMAQSTTTSIDNGINFTVVHPLYMVATEDQGNAMPIRYYNSAP